MLEHTLQSLVFVLEDAVFTELDAYPVDTGA
jgi:hypothetical protein